jgi:hypothetical protein
MMESKLTEGVERRKGVARLLKDLPKDLPKGSNPSLVNLGGLGPPATQQEVPGATHILISVRYSGVHSPEGDTSYLIRHTGHPNLYLRLWLIGLVRTPLVFEHD